MKAKRKCKQFIHSENARKADIINLLKRNQMQKETTANYRHTENLLSLLHGQGLTADTHNPQKSGNEKKELPLLRRGQGRSCPVGTSSPTLNVDEHSRHVLSAPCQTQTLFAAQHEELSLRHVRSAPCQTQTLFAAQHEELSLRHVRSLQSPGSDSGGGATFSHWSGEKEACPFLVGHCTRGDGHVP